MDEASVSVEEMIAEKFKAKFPTGSTFTVEGTGMTFEVVNAAGELLTAKVVEIRRVEEK